MSNPTTQSFIPIKEIRDGIILREDGFLCGIIAVTSINFSLKSAEERTAIFYQFEELLNSLEVSIQILIQSRRLNIRPYIKFLESVHERQDNELMRFQTREYINFIINLTENNDIMTKHFYVIVTYSPINLNKKGLLSFFNKDNSAEHESFQENKTQLIQRMDFIQNNIRSLGGLKSVRLDTQATTELIYQTFNPGDTQTPTGIL